VKSNDVHHCQRSLFPDPASALYRDAVGGGVMSEFPTAHEWGEATGALLGDAVKGFCWGIGFGAAFLLTAKLYQLLF
jgi:hypothetical protein